MTMKYSILNIITRTYVIHFFRSNFFLEISINVSIHNFFSSGHVNLSENATVHITDNQIRGDFTTCYFIEEIKKISFLPSIDTMVSNTVIEITKDPFNVFFNGSTTIPSLNKKFILSWIDGSYEIIEVDIKQN